MSDTFNCPYCEYEYVDDLHEYFQNNRDSTIIECDKCNKDFRVYQEFTVDYESSALPCVLGKPHEFRRLYTWEGQDFMKCRWCDKKEQRQSKMDASE